MDFAKVVCQSEPGHRMRVTHQLAGKVKTQAPKAPGKQPDTQIEAFFVEGANLVYIGSPYPDYEFDASAFKLAMAIIRVNAEQNAFTRVFVINLLHYGQIEKAKQMSADCLDISRPTIARHLNHAGHARSQVCNKVIGVLIVTLARQMRANPSCAGQCHETRRNRREIHLVALCDVDEFRALPTIRQAESLEQ
jgi:hypothetical protein